MSTNDHPELDPRKLPGGVVPERLAVPDARRGQARAVNIDHPATTAPIEPDEPEVDDLPKPKVDQK